MCRAEVPVRRGYILVASLSRPRQPGPRPELSSETVSRRRPGTGQRQAFTACPGTSRPYTGCLAVSAEAARAKTRMVQRDCLAQTSRNRPEKGFHGLSRYVAAIYWLPRCLGRGSQGQDQNGPARLSRADVPGQARDRPSRPVPVRRGHILVVSLASVNFMYRLKSVSSNNLPYRL